MTNTDTLASSLITIKNGTNVGKTNVVVKPASKLLGEVLKVMQKGNYVGDFEFVDDGRSGSYKIKLTGNINKCAVIKPRLAVKYVDFEQYEKRFLPAQGIGLLVVSTPQGIMSQREAFKRKTGGRLVAFVY